MEIEKEIENIERRLEELKEASAILEPDAGERKSLREEIITYTEQFLESMDSRPAFVAGDPGTNNELSDMHPEEQMPLTRLLDLMKRTLDHDGIDPSSGGHLGYIPGGGIYLSSLADYWVAITNRYAGVFYANPGAVRIENKLIRWMAGKVGYPETAHGNLASGGSIANLISIVTARETKNISALKIPTACIYMTRQVHHSVAKAMKVASLHECQVRYVPMDEHFRMDADALNRQVETDRKMGLVPFLVVASAGTTDAGAVDPLDAIADVAEAHGLWFHVDAAYGGFFVLTEEGRQKFKGIERSDSVVVDPHKGMFLPYGLGICLVRDKVNLQKAFTFQASYLQDIAGVTEEINPMDVSPEMTKHFRGLRMWLPLVIYGETPFRKALEEKLLLAKYAWHRLCEIPEMEVDAMPQLSVVTFRYKASNPDDQDAFNQAVMKEIHRDGRVFFSSTRIEGRFTLRFAILAYKTHKSTVDTALKMLQEASEKIREKRSEGVSI